ncbi:MAG: TIGR04551 family protein [Myxococcales bacterium]|nr:TIGR04551 family protein [Myxococcales bacterium]USN49919.1 MAG: TIGR04551 family protein [Myxococcales bacterium]
MAFFRAHILKLFFFLSFVNVSLYSDENIPVPELPPEEQAYEESKVNEEPSKVINFENQNIRADFFSDTAANRGFSRFLNALELSGYLRTRLNYFRNPHLGTYITSLGRGTSMFLPNLRGYDSSSDSEANPAQNNFSANMRLRLVPTINISETIRVKATLDILDNMVMGSTPSYMAGMSFNPSNPIAMMSMSQSTPMLGVNTLDDAIRVKRVWGEASFPIGEFRFGRMPFHWGLGLLYHGGNGIDSDYGDQVDGFLFSTKVFDHYLSPGYFFAYTGPNARGGGLGQTALNHPNYFLMPELGARYPLESNSTTHVFSLSLLKRHSDFVVHQKLEEGSTIFNYGIFASYRKQKLDSQYQNPKVDGNNAQSLVVERDANVGLLSLWSALSVGTFHLEMEFAGVWGKYQIGEKDTDLLAKDSAGNNVSKSDVWMLSGGAAIESKYGFISDRLQLGLDAGWASSGPGLGFGVRGKKPHTSTDFKTDFTFNPGYTLDLLLYREVLGTVSGTFYVKPHLAYFFNRNFGIRSDIISSFAYNKANTSGDSHFLGIESDTSAFIRTESGFYFSLAYGILFPLKGLNHKNSAEITPKDMKIFGEAKVAQTLQTYIGLVF